MAEERKTNDGEHEGNDEISDTELNALFDALSLDVPDPPSAVAPDWVMGELILDPHQYNCEYVQWLMNGTLRRVCTLHEEECDLYTHAVWRARAGRDVPTLQQCTWHVDRLTGYCRLCRVEEAGAVVQQWQQYVSYREPAVQSAQPRAQQRVRGRRSRRIKQRVRK